MKKSSIGYRGIAALLGMGAVFGTAAFAQADPYAVVHVFNSTDGNAPSATLTADGTILYGTTASAGSVGSLFSLDTTTQDFNSIYSFHISGPDNSQGISSSLTLLNGTLYGLATSGGAGSSNGSLFSYNIAAGTETTVHSFTGYPDDGKAPSQNSMIASGSTLYGFTNQGGTVNPARGTIFSFDTATNTETVLHTFDDSGNGADPRGAPVLSGNTLYGVAYNTSGYATGGTLFSFDLDSSTLSKLHTFGTGSDGVNPSGTPLLSGNMLYGLTGSGGDNGHGAIWAYDLNTDTESVLYSFGDITNDGSSPQGSLLLADGVLYGTTNSGGADGKGTLFAFDLSTGEETILHSFAGTGNDIVDGANPVAGLTYVDGVLYGVTSSGGGATNGGYGTIFSYAVPEPASLALMGLSAAGLLLKRRKK